MTSYKCGFRRRPYGSSRSLLYRLLPIWFPSRNCQGLPCSRETLMTICCALRPRRDRVRAMGPRVNAPDAAPTSNHGEGSPRVSKFSALNHTASGLAVYTSWCGLPSLHAGRASGCWSQLCRTGFQPARFLRKVSERGYSPPFPSFHGARFALELSPCAPSAPDSDPLSYRQDLVTFCDRTRCRFRSCYHRAEEALLG
jgi:hypothetical protein